MLDILVNPLRAFFLSTLISIGITFSEFRKRRANYVIGVLAVIVVVFVVAILLGGVAKGPLIFMKLAEDSTGEMDMLFIRSNLQRGELPFLNQTDMELRTNDEHLKDDLNGILPRWYVTASATKKWPRNDRERNASVGTTLMMIDSKKEKRLGIGRKWGHRRLGESEVHVKDSVLRELGIEAEAGEHIILTIHLNTFLSQAEINVLDVDILNAAGVDTQLSLNGTTGAATSALGLSDDDELNLNVSALSDTLESLFGISIGEIPPESQIQTINVGQARAALPETNITTNGTTVNLQDLLSLTEIRLDMDVVSAISDPGGKYPSAVGNAVVLDSTYFLHTVLEQLCYTTQRNLLASVGVSLPALETLADTFDMDSAALTVVAMFKDRRSIYTSPLPTLTREVTIKSDAIMRELDVRFNATVAFPLAIAMEGFYYLRLLLDQIFTAVIITIAVLGCILIYSLLLSNVEEKTFEHGMLRALGFRRASLINLITVQAMAFAIPGVVVAISLSVVANVLMEEVVASFSGFPADHGNISSVALAVPILLGILVPLLANIVPIRRAMGNTLRAALDISHQAMSETQVTVQKLEDLGLELWQTLLAIFMVICGFIVYYMMPYSFIFNDLPLFFLLLLLILMGMLFGLCMISASLQSPMELGILKCLLWGEDKALQSLISKNLSGHRSRSSKTYMMFTISTASIIFGGVVFVLQANSIISNIEVLVGADLQGYSLDLDWPLNRTELDDFLVGARQRENSPVVDWAYTTFPIDAYDQIKSAETSNLLFFPSVKQTPRGVSSNFLNVVRNEYFIPTEIQNGISKSDIISSLYTKKSPGSTYSPQLIASGVPLGEELPNFERKYSDIIDVVISAGSRDLMSVDTSTNMKLELEYREDLSSDNTGHSDYLARPRALIRKLPGFPFVISSYSFLLPQAPLLMSIENFHKILRESTSDSYLQANTNDANKDLTLVYFDRIFVKLRKGLSSQERESFSNELKNHLDRDNHVLLDTEDLRSSTQLAVNLLLTFFYCISAVAVSLNLFLLWTSFTTNVRQNAWSFAVMRSVGFTVDQLVKAYIFEALCTILSALICGCVIGIFIALTLSAQFNMFLELPMDFEFPYILFIVVTCEAVFTSILGSWWPAQELRKKEIAQVLKSQ